MAKVGSRIAPKGRSLFPFRARKDPAQMRAFLLRAERAAESRVVERMTGRGSLSLRGKGVKVVRRGQVTNVIVPKRGKGAKPSQAKRTRG